MSRSLSQEVRISAPAGDVYKALTDEKEFSAFAGGDAVIQAQAGGRFSLFDGRITGVTIEYLPGKRLVQAWRAGAWQEGVYSIVTFEFKAEQAETVLNLEQSGFPEGEKDHLDAGWHKMYWQPLEEYLR